MELLSVSGVWGVVSLWGVGGMVSMWGVGGGDGHRGGGMAVLLADLLGHLLGHVHAVLAGNILADLG